MSEFVRLIKKQLGDYKIALVHDYLVQDGGAERVFLNLNKIFPQADIHVLLYNKKTNLFFKNKKIYTSFLNNWPLAKKYYQWYLPLLPIAVEHLDFKDYDLVISSSSSFVKGIITTHESKHICYLHTPTRFLWENRINYIDDLPLIKPIRALLPFFLHHLRQWDQLASTRPDFIITNSYISQKRILNYYKRQALIINPSIDTDQIKSSRHKGDYWLTGGRLVAYKKFNLVIEAFKHLNLPLMVFGTGPELKKLKNIAKYSKKIKFLGNVSDREKINLYRYSIGFINPQLEDFGITTLEAMSAGKPVLTYKKGGGSEIITPGMTGEFLDEQTWEDIAYAVIKHNPKKYNPDFIHKQAEKFSFDIFEKKILQVVAKELEISNNVSEEELASFDEFYG